MSLGLAGGTSVMFAGNLGPVQGLETAVRAAARLTDLPDFRLVLVGDGVARESLERLRGELGAENVLFLGSRPLEQMNAITAAADAQLVSLLDRPFLRGTVPSKLGTVMASGLPVICAAGGDARALVESAGAGWTCESEDVDALELVFRAVHAAPQAERRRRGAAGRAFYETTMARSIGVARIERVLQAAARR
jgi:glycosyltransferase involved in cell wall biosynthesis